MTTLMMNSTIERSVIDMCTSFACMMVRDMATRHGLDAETEIRALNLDAVKLVRKAGGASKRSGDEKEKKAKEPKSTRDESNLPKFQLPFCGVILENCCNGIRLNHSLYTQCLMEPKENGFCKTCKKQADQNASGKPTYGVIQDRAYGEAQSFKDPKGKNVVPYANVMGKLKITREDAEAEAARLGWTIAEEEFVVSKGAPGRPKKIKTDADAEDKPKKQVGRPKKEKKVISGNEGDNLIAKLVAQAKANGEEASNNNSSESDDEAEETEAVEEKKVDKAAEKEAKKAEKEAAKATEKEARKAEKEAAKAAEKEAKKAEKEAAKAAEKEAKKAEKEAAKDAKKEAKKAEKSAEKETKKKDEKTETEKKTDKPVVVVEEEEAVAVKVKKFEHKGKTYAKSSDGIVYDIKTQEPVGKWNIETESIDELENDSSSEEEAESYSEEDDE
jgi:chemotaxis protein histidine kinase CheA